MKQLIAITLMLVLFTACMDKTVIKENNFTTVCNPIDLSYRFRPEKPSRREAADPTVITFKGRYFLFASKSGGYWHSNDLTKWTFVRTTEIPTEEYAPTAIAIGDTVYFLASSKQKSTIYKSADPLSGKWEVAKDSIDVAVWDPAFYQDDDGRLYLYWGCSNTIPIRGIELDYKNNFAFIGEPKDLIAANYAEYGWEERGDYNSFHDKDPWVEGAWVNKYQGKYYLQYAAPGTQFKSYNDGVYVSDKPLGTYKIAPHNPFAYKPEGFAAGAGHGNTLTDDFGNYWHFGTISISMRDRYERRLGMFPSFFDEDGIFYSITKYGDYPLIVPNKKIENFQEIFPGWMLLSFMKKVNVSSSIDSLPPSNMVNEDIRSYWSAKSGKQDEWASIDMGEQYDVYAIQINFADHETQIFDRQDNLYYKYEIEYSNDNTKWELLVDKSDNKNDNSHPYFQLPEKTSCRYLRIKNKGLSSGHFAISGFRVFGLGNGDKPQEVKRFEVLRNAEDKRKVTLNWEKSENATGYNISYGSIENKLYHNYIVYDNTSVTINSLNANQDYYFTIEAFNENGITKSEIIIQK